MTCCQSDTHVVNKTTKKREKNRDVWDRPCVKPGQTFIFPAARCVSVFHLFVGVSSGVWFVQRSPHWSTSAESEERSCWRIRTTSHILITPRVGLKSIHQPEETEQKQIPLLTDVLTLEIMMRLLYLLLLLLPSFSLFLFSGAHFYSGERLRAGVEKSRLQSQPATCHRSGFEKRMIFFELLISTFFKSYFRCGLGGVRHV